MILWDIDKGNKVMRKMDNTLLIVYFNLSY